MKNKISLSIFLFLIISMASLYAKEASSADAVYEKIRKQIISGDVKADYKSLRINCVDSKYSCEESSDVKKKIRALLTDKKYSKALKETNKTLKKVFVDVDLHYFAFIANIETGHKEKAEFHKAVIGGLLDSIQENKRGRSEEDAFTVINVHEEYAFLQFSGVNIHGQALLRKDGHSYDVMTCSIEQDNELFKVYFNIDIPMNRLSELLNTD